MREVLLSIAGYDPTSGAGVILDINVFQRLGFMGMGIITSLTVQNTQRVENIYCPPPNHLWNQYDSLQKDVRIFGLKVGMLGCRQNINPIGRILSQNSHIPRVVDPIVKSSSRAWLLEKEAIPDYLNAIAGHTDLITPNVEEAGMIVGKRIKTFEMMREAAVKIHELCGAPCLITGGHFQKEAVDILFDGNDHHIFSHKWYDVRVHGTGCFLSASLLAFLRKGNTIKEACQQAIGLTQRMIQNSVCIGHGQKLFTFSDK